MVAPPQSSESPLPELTARRGIIENADGSLMEVAEGAF